MLNQQNKSENFWSNFDDYVCYWRLNIHRFAIEYLGIQIHQFQQILLYLMDAPLCKGITSFIFFASRGLGGLYVPRQAKRRKKSMGKYVYDKDFFESVDTEEKAYWLGFFMADGCINELKKNDKTKSMDFEITLCEKDYIHLEKLKQSLKTNVPIKKKNVKLNNKNFMSYRLTICCTKFCKDLIKYGCTPNKTFTLKFPENVPENLKNHVIRGYFDGDGGVYCGEYDVLDKRYNKMRKQFKFSVSFTGNYNMLKYIHDFLLYKGIKNTISNHKENKLVYELRIYGVKNIENFYIFLYKNSNIFLDRKKEKFEYAFNKIKNRPPKQ